MKRLKKLIDHSKRIRLLESTSYLLEWDQEIHMPPGGADHRSEQLALLASLSHQERTNPQFAEELSKFIDLESGQIVAKGCTQSEAALLKNWRRDYRKDAALPNAFVKKFAKLTAQAIPVWTEARKEDNFKAFAPKLQRILDMCRQKADYLGYEKHPYDALLDIYEPEMTVAQLDPLFQKLGKEIRALLQEIQGAKQLDNACLHGKFSEAKQLTFGKTLLTAMGYDFERGRLDLSTHPFSMALHPTDSRVTTRIHTTSLFDSLSACMHEGGHSLYEMGMDPVLYGTPLCEPVSLGIHESQSRLWETRIGQSKPFWKHFLPLLKEEFKGKLEGVTLDAFYKAINKVEPTFIRVEADEVTYSLHVILRYELEKSLIDGSLPVKELPEAWNAGMQHFLGITPPTNAQGCLQDIHWAMGGFGYFPTYTLGNLYASHFFEAFTHAFPNWERDVAKGHLLFLREWLREQIHKHGRTYTASELAQRVGGKPLSPTPYLSYLQAKYRALYRLGK